MDKHNQLEENLVAYLANELSTAERAELEQHLLGCAPCRESLVRARAVLDQADALPQIEPPPGYTQRVLHAARAAQQQARLHEERLRPAADAPREALLALPNLRRLARIMARVVVYASVVVIALIYAAREIPPMLGDRPAGTPAARTEETGPKHSAGQAEHIASIDHYAPPSLESELLSPKAGDLEFVIPPLSMGDEHPPGPLVHARDDMIETFHVIKTDVPNDTYAARLDWRTRKAAMRAASADSSAAHAIRRGIWWLVRHQHPDGKWDAAHFAENCKGRDCKDDHAPLLSNEAVTAAALLAMLGDGNLPGAASEFQVRVARGLRWLQSRQQPNGAIGTEKPGDPHFILAHSLATAALAEAFGMTGDKHLELAARKAAEYLLQHEIPVLDANQNVIRDAFAAAAVRVAALGAVETSRLDLPRGIAAQSAKIFGQIGARPTAAYTYPWPGPTILSHVTPGMIALAAPGAEADKALLIAEASALRSDPPDWKKSNHGHVYWLAGSAIMKKAGGNPYRKWHQALQTTLVKNQHESGHAIGSWAPNDPGSRLGGRVFSTALAILALETPYR